MIPDIERTIVALASAPRPARRAIVRLTGPQTQNILSRLFELPLDAGPLACRRLVSANLACSLPEIQPRLTMRLLFWPDQRSYTGQPSAELHLIGCLPLAEALIARCCQLGAQPAQRGEFTLRAFLSGKLDLSQAEAVLGVIDADSPESLRIALTQLGGNLAPAVRPLRDTIINIVAELEAGLDFVDEDIEFISADLVMSQLRNVHQALTQFSARLHTRTSTDVAPRVVLLGLPNSGKSSLFNALCESEIAIVANVPGTTRDYLQQRFTVNGTDIELIDTAGWEELQGDSPRAMAQQQLLACLKSAQLCLLCVDCTRAVKHEDLHSAISRIERVPAQWLLVGTKIDLESAELKRVAALAPALSSIVALAAPPIGTSSRTRSGLNTLLTAISEALSRSADETGPLAVVHQTAVRCRAAVTAALVGINEALSIAEQDGGEELIAAELRLVLEELATIIGEVHSDDILGEIFSRFCIGK